MPGEISSTQGRRSVAVLTGPDRPDVVALHQPVEDCDPDGRIAAALDAGYEPRGEVAGVPLLSAS